MKEDTNLSIGTQLGFIPAKHFVTDCDKNSSSDQTSQKVVENNFCSKFPFFRYPKGVFFCLGNEFSERFSFYGMTAILTLYMVNVHHHDEYTAKLMFHTFHFVAYFTPILGSILADGYLGRFRVILYVSFAYCGGHLLLTLGSLPNIIPDVGKWLDYIGLFTIAFATGGIKPCVVSFAADQFPPTMVKERKQFFSFFYFSINSGAMISTFITPIFRSKVSCYGQEGCYPLAFGVPAIFMALALTIFICGKPFYKIVRCEENVIWNVCKCVTTALIKTVKNFGPPSKGGHWLDHSVPTYGQGLVTDIKGIFSIMVLYIPLIFFCALFNQQGSTWVIQANKMNGRVGQLTIIPEQISILNPLLIIILIPLFEQLIYPILAKHYFLTTPLRRMGWGGVLVAVSFFVAGFIQLKINKTSVEIPLKEFVKFKFMNFGYCDVKLFNSSIIIKPYTSITTDVKISGDGKLVCEYVNCNKSVTSLLPALDHKQGQFVVFWNNGTVSQTSFILEKTKGSQTRIYPVFHPSFYDNSFDNVSIIMSHNGMEKFRFTVGSSKQIILILHHRFLDPMYSI